MRPVRRRAVIKDKTIARLEQIRPVKLRQSFDGWLNDVLNAVENKGKGNRSPTKTPASPVSTSPVKERRDTYE